MNGQGTIEPGVIMPHLCDFSELATEQQALMIKAVELLLVQGCVATKDGNCVYRSPEGHKCIVGGLVAEEHYDPGFENEPVSEQSVIEALAKSNSHVAIDAKLQNHLYRMQQVHDAMDGPYEPASKAGFREEVLQRVRSQFNPISNRYLRKCADNSNLVNGEEHNDR